MKKIGPLSAWDIAYSTNMGLASLVSYLIVTSSLSRFVGNEAGYLGGMWAAVATVFVFRDSRELSLSAGAARFIATCVSFALCLIYLCIFPFTALGMAVIVGVGTALMMLLGRRSDIVTTAITTVVVMVVAGMDAQHAWLQPILRLVDTVVGIVVGIGAKWIGSALFYTPIAKSTG
jgi:uncharacterized membrane protein YccC